jgi:hypothetical protein
MFIVCRLRSGIGENVKIKKSSPVTGLEWPRGSQEVKVKVK